MEISEGRVEANDISFAYLECGSGPLALCLHGFPDSPWTWRYLMPELAAAGFRAVAPFTRGYAPTGIPESGLYQIATLASDAVALHEALGGDGDAVLIGHDFGAIAAYPAAVLAPERWRRVVAASVPPVVVASQALIKYDQLKLSWYTFLFQHFLSDVVVAMDDMAFLDRLWEDWSPGFDGSEFVARAKDCLRDPANLTAALSYYRAMLMTGLRDPGLDPIEALAYQSPAQPTLYLHGDQDGCMAFDGLDGVAEALPSPGSRVEVIAGAGHFLQLEQPELVNRLIIDFVTA